ncbi:hypothetical protein [Devosia aquimaris]|nr:hypothetical protein [Devosia sp. CJK-A8-3]
MVAAAINSAAQGSKLVLLKHDCPAVNLASHLRDVGAQRSIETVDA